jgi:hypothetical protein
MMTQRMDKVISSYKCHVHRLPNTVTAVCVEVTLPGSVQNEEATDIFETTGAVEGLEGQTKAHPVEPSLYDLSV